MSRFHRSEIRFKLRNGDRSEIELDFNIVCKKKKKKQENFKNDKYEKHSNVIVCLKRTKLNICFLSLLIPTSNQHTFLPRSSKHLSDEHVCHRILKTDLLMLDSSFQKRLLQPTGKRNKMDNISCIHSLLYMKFIWHQLMTEKQ